MNKQHQYCLLATLCGLSLTAQASEGGGSTYTAGVENYMAGAVPPPGLHLLGYGERYSADSMRDNSGQKRPIPGFKVTAAVAALRVVWSTPQALWGGNLVFHSIVPLVDLRVSAGGATQHKTGLGDITVGTGIAFHHSAALHTVLGLDLVLPTGGYQQADLANIGRHYASAQPLYALSYIDPTGFNGDFKLTFNLNQKNSATQYQSGSEVVLDYAAGYGLGNGWTLGLGGYWRNQYESDVQAGAVLANSRARAFAIGPSLRYDNGKGWFLTAKVQTENAVRNTTQGQAFWVKAVIPF